jgi:hypothetical protein
LLGFGAPIAAQIRSYWNDDWNDGRLGIVRRAWASATARWGLYGRSSRTTWPSETRIIQVSAAGSMNGCALSLLVYAQGRLSRFGDDPPGAPSFRARWAP